MLDAKVRSTPDLSSALELTSSPKDMSPSKRDVNSEFDSRLELTLSVKVTLSQPKIKSSV
jgi:hypothetical protein